MDQEGKRNQCLLLRTHLDHCWIATVVVALGIFATQQQTGTAMFAVGLVVAAAAMLSGGLIGFVFGVPRMLTADSPERRTDVSGAVVANTNLEQISDWLTKILVGVGLTQFQAIGNAAQDLFDALAPSFGGAGTGKAFAGGLVTFSAAFGFVTGWLYTRLLLGAAMVRADRKAAAAALNKLAEQAEQRGDSPSATELREQARDVLRGFAPVGAAYERTRRSMPAGPARTAEFDRLADEARAIARIGEYDPVAVTAALARGGEGERVAALTVMELHPDAVYLETVKSVAVGSRSADEQYRALLVIRGLVSRVSEHDREQLRTVMEDLRASLPPSTSRAKLVTEIINLLDQHDS